MSTIHLPSFAPATSWPAAPAPGQLIRTLLKGFSSAIVRLGARARATQDALPPGGETVAQSRDRHAQLYIQAERVMSTL
jgi:hypothetical protein